MSVFELWLQLPTTTKICAATLAALVLAFLFYFFFPWFRLAKRLREISRALAALDSPSPSEIEPLFQADANLLHLWKEFRETLHEQRAEHDGRLKVTAYRATAPAESYFSAQNVVDGRLRTEFFKHLPGLFTGIGIIGTFLGLIDGLQSFEVPDDPARVRASLDTLLHGVYEAFVVSASAITLAMLVTLIEKLILASLYRQTESLAQRLDQFFAMGAGEEYLARLVSASEDSAAQAKILKDALVGDLKQILHELTERQIAAQRESTHALAQNISEGIKIGLEGPLTRIGNMVEKASGDQSATAANLLQDVMASFSQRIHELFGGQISGLQDLMQKSGQELQQAVSALNVLVAKMEDNARRSADEMGDKMAAAIENMERRQVAINEQSQRFLEAMRELTASSQADLQEKLRLSVSDLGTQMASLIASLQAEAKLARHDQRERERAHSENARSVVQNLSDSSVKAMESVRECGDQMKATVIALERITTSAIDKMNAGAGRLETGATAFADASGRVSQAMGQTATVAGKMTEVSGVLTSSTAALRDALNDYRDNRQATTAMVTELRAIVDAAKRDAAFTRETLGALQTATRQLGDAQRQAGDYIEGVGKILGESHAVFAEGLVKVIDRANSEFHTKLSNAVSLLGDAVQELEVTLSGAIPER